MADVPVYKSKWQLQKDEKFRIRFNLDEIKDKRVQFSLEEKGEYTVEHWVEFKMWDYYVMVSMRKKATKYHQESGSFYVDHDLFNDFKIKNLLQDWSFAQLEPHMKLQHSNGVLTDESFQTFREMYPWVVSAIINKMNIVLEGIES